MVGKQSNTGGQSDAEPLPSENDVPQVQFDISTHEFVPDWAGMCSIPFDTESEGIRTFRALIVQRGKVLHVPERPGHYVVDGEWTMQPALSIVHFVPTTGRAPELLLSFMDFTSVSSISSGLFVESLKLPLQIKKNVYQDTVKLTKVADVAGFSKIDAKQAPWSLHLSHALAKQLVFRAHRINNPSDMEAFCSLRLSERVDQLTEWSKIYLKEEVKQLQRQDARMAEKQRMQFEARLSKVVSQIQSIPPEAYDMPFEQRITRLADMDADLVSSTFKTPQRQSLSDGTAPLAMTRFLEKAPTTVDLATDVAANAQPDAPQESTSSNNPPPPKSPEHPCSPPASDAPNDDDEPLLNSVKKRNNRAKAVRFNPMEGRKSNRKPKPTAASKESKEKPEVEINPRTGLPYVKGPYGPRKLNLDKAQQAIENRGGGGDVPPPPKEAKEAGALKQKEAELAKAQQLIAKLQSELREANARIVQLQEAKALAVSNAELTATKSMAEQLLTKYQQGLMDGARLCSGRMPTPDSLSFGTPNSASQF